MTYLLDTNVVSALRVRERHRSVEVWAASVPVGEQFVSAFAIAEIERGVRAKERSDADQGAVLRRWFDDALIAAVAESAGMTIATRNTKHVEPLGVACLNPWDTSG